MLEPSGTPRPNGFDALPMSHLRNSPFEWWLHAIVVEVHGAICRSPYIHSCIYIFKYIHPYISIYDSIFMYIILYYIMLCYTYYNFIYYITYCIYLWMVTHHGFKMFTFPSTHPRFARPIWAPETWTTAWSVAWSGPMSRLQYAWIVPKMVPSGNLT